MTDRRCPGSGKRTRPTGSSAFPEQPCPDCDYYARPVCKDKAWDIWTIRVHRPVVDAEVSA